MDPNGGLNFFKGSFYDWYLSIILVISFSCIGLIIKLVFLV